MEKKKRSEESFRDIWDNTECINIWIKGVSEEDERKKWYEKIIEEIRVEIVPQKEMERVKQSKRQKEPHTG